MSRLKLVPVAIAVAVAAGCAGATRPEAAFTVDTFTIPESNNEVHLNTRNIGIGLWFSVDASVGAPVSVTERMTTNLLTMTGYVYHASYPHIITGFQSPLSGRRRYQSSPNGVLALRYHGPGQYTSQATMISCQFADGTPCAIRLGNDSIRPFMVG